MPSMKRSETGAAAARRSAVSASSMARPRSATVTVTGCPARLRSPRASTGAVSRARVPSASSTAVPSGTRNPDGASTNRSGASKGKGERKTASIRSFGGAPDSPTETTSMPAASGA